MNNFPTEINLDKIHVKAYFQICQLRVGFFLENHLKN